MTSVPSVFARPTWFLTRAFSLGHALHHRVMVHWRILRHSLILCRRQAGEFSDKRDHIPDKTIVMRLPPRRHSGHLDSMLDDPELLRSRTLRTFKQDGCLRIQPLNHLGFFNSGRQMAAAAHLRVQRSEARRVGKECVSTGSTWW